MTASLKRNTNGSLRAIKKYEDWWHYIYESGTPTTTVLARDCTCCELNPDGLLTEAIVDTGESETITGSGTAEFPGYFTDGYGGFGDRYCPSATWNWGGIGTATWTYYPPGQTSLVPAGITVDGSGKNAKDCSALVVTIGDETAEDWAEFDTFPSTATITATCSFGARLIANIEEIPRNNSGSGIWGPRPRYTDLGTKDAVDLRKYKSAGLEYYYWDADASGGSVTITAFGETEDAHSVTVAGTGAPRAVAAGTAALTNANAGLTDEASLSMTFFGSQAFPMLTRTIYDDPPTNSDGAQARSDGHTVYARPDGASSDFRRISISLTNIQPQRTYTSDFQIVSPHGLGFADGAFTLSCYDGPDPGSDGAYAVNTKYPIDDAGTTGTDEGVPISIGVPTDPEDPWTGTGTAYGIEVTGLLDTTMRTVMSEALDTIGDPAFGFIYSPSALDSGGASGDNWRCPIRIPADAASWVAARLKVRSAPTFPATPAWSAGAGTSIDGTAVTGAGTLTISQLLTTDWLVDNYRYLVLRLKASEASQTGTLSIGAKEWAFTLPVAEADVTFDLCNPTNGTGFDATTSRLEVRAAAGGWGWGIDGEVTLTLTSDAAFDVYSPTRLAVTSTAGALLVGETLHRWLDPFRVGDIVLREGETYEDTITTYAARGILYISDGRAVLDEEIGLTADGFENAYPLNVAYQPWLVLKIGDVLRAANVRQGNSSVAAVALLEDRKPARFVTHLRDDGLFQWMCAADFFTNHVEAYMLRPTSATVTGATYDIYADYCVDRIKPGVGVSCTLGSIKWLGGGLHGLTVVGGVADDAAVSSGSSDATARTDGYYELPGDEPLNSNTGTAASVSTGWDGSPEQDVVEGTLMRVTVRK